jgi:hypothetical protein
MDAKQQYHEKKLATRIVTLADQCRGDVHAKLRKIGAKLSAVDAAEVNLLIGHAIREAMLAGRSFERWFAEHRGRPGVSSRQRVIVSPDATSMVDPGYDDDKTTEKMPRR